MNRLPSAGGNYVLFLELSKTISIRVGRLGSHFFQPGIYAYVGSAFGSGGLRARLGRHLRTGPVRRWHIDHLRSCSKVAEVWWSRTPENLEHFWAASLLSLRGAVMPVKGFGSSDCRCPAHLVHFSVLPTTAGFRRRLRSFDVKGLPPHRVTRWANKPAAPHFTF